MGRDWPDMWGFLETDRFRPNDPRCGFHKRRFHNDSRESLNVRVADKNEARQSHFHGSGIIVKLILVVRLAEAGEPSTICNLPCVPKAQALSFSNWLKK
jgi:hypothetical protein